jgi:putative endopeptidase
MSASDHQPEKCACCNNPWAAATGDFFAQLCQTCVEEDKPGFGVDSSVKPSDDFYLYANQKWITENPIPPGYPSWNTFLHLHTLSQERLKDLLQELKDNAAKSDGATNDENTEDENAKKVQAFYAAAMNEDKIEEDSTTPLKPVLDLCKKASECVSDKSALSTVLGELLSKYGVSAFFGLSAGPDNKNSSHSIAQISQGGLGLPDRDYYFDEDKADKRDAYKKHVAKMLTLLEDPTCTADAEATDENISKANEIYEFELKIAKAHMTKTENRDPEATYNKMSLSALSSDTCHDKFDFNAYTLSATGKTVEVLGDINVRNTAALECVTDLVATVDPKLLEQYLRWRVVRSCANYMSKAFVMEDFNFNEKVLSGTDEIKPRWKRAMAFTESALGEALGQLYCAKYFDESCKGKALSIVENVRQALEDRLKEVDWIQAESTREMALKKMRTFKVKIGYPDKWIDYTSLKVDPEESFLEMEFRSHVFDHGRLVKEMNAPTDTEKWFMTPQTINAYYHPSLNEIVFPAAILQPPFFDPNTEDDAVNYGSMGAVVGHEMTHGFDDKGRKFNFEGNMQDWWTPEDAATYEKRVDVMVEQANAYEVHGQRVQGKLTCGENIADLGGLRLSLRALVSQAGFDATKTIAGFTAVQRFFLGWAKCWRQNITEQRALQLLTLDPHGPNPMRCNGPLSNMEEFIEAFDVSTASPMFKPKEVRVDIW